MRSQFGQWDDSQISEGQYQEQQGLIEEAHREAVAEARRLRSLRPDELSWVTRDGRRILVADMTDQHVVNTIKMLRRNVEMYRLAFLSNMWRYMENAPDGAYDACVSAERETEEMSREEFLLMDKPTYAKLLREAHDRHLDISEMPTEQEINRAMLLWLNNNSGKALKRNDAPAIKNTESKSKLSNGPTLKSQLIQSLHSSLQLLTRARERRAGKQEK
jgi:hypothetical protein